MSNTCRFCLAEPTDWCPACQALLCDEHSRYHSASFDRRCTQGGPPMTEDWAQQIVVSEEYWDNPKYRERCWWLLNECIENRSEQNGIDPKTIRYDLREVVKHPEDDLVILVARGHFATEMP